MKMSKFPLKNPLPDFEALEKVLKGEKKPEKVDDFSQHGFEL